MRSIILGVSISKDAPTDQWPFTLKPVQQMRESGLDLSNPVTFLVGENGAGKSTIIEGLAEAYGIDIRGGHGRRKYNNSPEPGPLGSAINLRLRQDIKRGQGFFLRAESAQGVFEFMSNYAVPGFYGDKHLGEVSHGEGYLQVLEARFGAKGLYLLDEPEAPLSFQSCLVLLRELDEAAKRGSQIICATHSPILTALPGAKILEIDSKGIHETTWEDLEIVSHWRRYLADPKAYLRHLID